MNGFTASVYLLLVLAGFVSGYKVAAWRYDAAKVGQLQADLDAAQADADAADTARREADDLRAQADAKLLDFQERERINNDLRKSLVPRVVERNRVCDLGPGAIGLLNSAIGSSELSGTASGSEEGGASLTADSWYDPPPRPAP